MAPLAARAFQLYSAQLQRHPWRTQIVTTGALWALGDAVAQRVEGRPFDARRNLLTAAYGGLAVGPVGHAWYLGLDRMARRLFRPGSAAFVGGKVVADTAVFGPVHVAGYFAHMTLCGGGSWADVGDKLRRNFWPTFSAELTVWPVVQLANFKYVPVEYQLLVVNLFTIADAAFMSWARANDGWFQRLFPGLAGQLGMELPAPAAAAAVAKAAVSIGGGGGDGNGGSHTGGSSRPVMGAGSSAAAGR